MSVLVMSTAIITRAMLWRLTQPKWLYMNFSMSDFWGGVEIYTQRNSQLRFLFVWYIHFQICHCPLARHGCIVFWEGEVFTWSMCSCWFMWISIPLHSKLGARRCKVYPITCFMSSRWCDSSPRSHSRVSKPLDYRVRTHACIRGGKTTDFNSVVLSDTGSNRAGDFFSLYCYTEFCETPEPTNC